MREESLLLGVDGGGSKTHALVADIEGNVLARGVGPGSNHRRVGLEQSWKAITATIEDALRLVLGPRARPSEPGWRKAPIAAACLGLAGVDGPDDEAEVSRWVREQGIAPRFTVLNDCELILTAGTPRGWGVALISGTGSVCLGRSPDGRTLRVGGWGSMLGDEGSGYAIALRALHVAAQTADGRLGASALLNEVLRRWSLPDAQAMIRHVHGPAMTQAEIAALAPLVFELASEGDAAANAILGEAARDLAAHVDTAVRLLGLERPPLALAGGALQGTLRGAVLSAIRSDLGPVQYVADPSLGAIVLARRLLSPAWHA